MGSRWCRPPVEPNAGVGTETGPAHFTQPDSFTQLANPANANLYAYAADNPTNYTDPTGMLSLDDIAGGLIALGGALTAAITLPVTGPLVAVTLAIVGVTSAGSGVLIGCGITSLSECPQP